MVTLYNNNLKIFVILILIDSTNTADGDIDNEYTKMLNDFNELSDNIIKLFPEKRELSTKDLSNNLDEGFKYTTKMIKYLGINMVVTKYNKFREKVYYIIILLMYNIFINRLQIY